MEWIQVTIYTTTQGIEPVTGRLYQLGVKGVEIEDESEFNEYLENNAQYWDYVDDELREKMSGDTRVKVYISNNISGNETLLLIKESISELKKLDNGEIFGKLEITLSNLREEDWENNWKQYFKPLFVGDKILIKPQWEALPDDVGDRIVFAIEPGMIFGTGTHHTTQLCIEALEKYIKVDDMVLDLGCGSGILSIISLLLGASNALAIDIDPNAVPIASANAELNGLTKDRLKVLAGNVVTDSNIRETIGYGKYDVVVANIVADVIIALSSIVPKQLKPNGIFIVSGIIDERKDEVLQALKDNAFEMLEINENSGWVAIISKGIN